MLTQVEIYNKTEMNHSDTVSPRVCINQRIQLLCPKGVTRSTKLYDQKIPHLTKRFNAKRCSFGNVMWGSVEAPSSACTNGSDVNIFNHVKMTSPGPNSGKTRFVQ